MCFCVDIIVYYFASGGSRGEVLHWIGIAWSCMNVMERRIWKSSIRLETKLCLYQTYVSQFSCMGARHGPPQSTCTLVLMHLTCGHYARSWGYCIVYSIQCILATCQMWKSEEPLVVRHFFTWSLIDVCGSFATLLTVHLARTTTELLQWLSDKYHPTGSGQ